MGKKCSKMRSLYITSLWVPITQSGICGEKQSVTELQGHKIPNVYCVESTFNYNYIIVLNKM